MLGVHYSHFGMCLLVPRPAQTRNTCVDDMAREHGSEWFAKFNHMVFDDIPELVRRTDEKKGGILKKPAAA